MKSDFHIPLVARNATAGVHFVFLASATVLQKKIVCVWLRIIRNISVTRFKFHFVFLAFGALVLIWILSKYEKNSSRGKFPPGPHPWPFIGNPPHRALEDLAKRYEPLLFLCLGSFPTLVVSSSYMAKGFLKTHDLVFANKPSCATGKYIFYDHKEVVFAHSREYWRHMKKLCMFKFLTAKRVKSFKCVREEEFSTMVRSLWEASECGMHPVDVSKSLNYLSRNIICKMFAN